MAKPRIGRWETGPGGDVRLIASRCQACGETAFPERSTCPRCRSTDLREARLAGPATLTSYTLVHQVPAGFTGPMAVGYATFPEDVVVLAPIDALPERLQRGLQLRVTQGETSRAADGSPFVSYRFAPADGGEADAGEPRARASADRA